MKKRPAITPVMEQNMMHPLSQVGYNGFA